MANYPLSTICLWPLLPTMTCPTEPLPALPCCAHNLSQRTTDYSPLLPTMTCPTEHQPVLTCLPQWHVLQNPCLSSPATHNDMSYRTTACYPLLPTMTCPTEPLTAIPCCPQWPVLQKHCLSPFCLQWPVLQNHWLLSHAATMTCPIELLSEPPLMSTTRHALQYLPLVYNGLSYKLVVCLPLPDIHYDLSYKVNPCLVLAMTCFWLWYWGLWGKERHVTNMSNNHVIRYETLPNEEPTYL